MPAIVCLILATLAAAPEPSRTAAERQFQQQVDEYFAGHLAFRPHVALELGLHEYDGQLDDLSAAALDKELVRLKQFEQIFAQIPADGLSPALEFDRQVVLSEIRKMRFNFDGADIYRNNPLTYPRAISIDGYLIRDFAPLADRVKSIIAIERQLPQLFASARENLNKELPRLFVETAIKVTDGAASFLERDLPLAVTGLQDKTLRAELDAANKAAIAELRGYTAWLKTERLPHATEKFALGRDQFSRLLRELELVHMTPEQVLEIGLRELKREQHVFTATAELIDPTRPAIEVFKAIQEDHPTEQGLIPDTAANLELIRKFVVDRQLASFPSEVRCTVAETPPFRRATSFASMDAPGPFEAKAADAYYYVTPVDVSWTPSQKNEWLTAFNYYTTDVVSIHEAYPGHYQQHLHLNAAKISRVAKAFHSYAFVEGWAHYTEQLLPDEGFPAGADAIEKARYRLAQSDEALLRLCRLCCSLQMHTAGMTIDEATAFFEQNCYYQTTPARQEAVRGSFDPKYLNYTLGKWMILKLREDWRKQEGDKFTLGRFHDELLRHGAPPVPLLRRAMLKDRAQWDAVLN